ncbi:MAG: hypothetical protein AAF488_17625, partial [Planctomycetota bacterium]
MRRPFSFLLAWVLAFGLSTAYTQEDPFLEFDFDEDDALVEAFFNPTGLEALDVCGTVIPAGEARIEDGEVVMQNDELNGLCLLGLSPAFVEDSFPEDVRDYRVRVLVWLEDVNQLLVYIRARATIRADGSVDSAGEVGYAFSVLPDTTHPDLPDGGIGLTEFNACHEVVEHPEWPNNSDGSTVAVAQDPIVSGELYWVEISAQGDDEGGPVLLTGKIWVDGEDEPESPQISVVDPNGLDHTPESLLPEANTQVFFGTSFDFGQQPSAVARLDDLSVTAISGCTEPPVSVVRTLWGETQLIEGAESATYAEGDTYPVSLALGDRRPEGTCDAASSAVIVESIPAGWEAQNVSNDGSYNDAEGTLTWTVDLSQDDIPTLTYEVVAGAGLSGTFHGTIAEPDSEQQSVVSGPTSAINEGALSAVSDFGSIQHWLILGQFETDGLPDEDGLRLDYITDGDATQTSIRPRAGDSIDTDFGGTAASLGLAPNSEGRNPEDLPTWIEWRDLDDDDDRIDVESIYGGADDVVIYAFTYLNVEFETEVSFGVSSDDGVQLLLDGEEIHNNSTARGAMDRNYQDLPAGFESLGNITLEEGQHTLLAKIFDRGGEHNFRVGFVDEFGLELLEAPDGITISLVPDDEPPPPPPLELRRGDADASGSLNITDGIFILNFLFLGGPD